MENLQRIEIGPAPWFPDVVRKVVVTGKNEDYSNRTVTLICQLEYYDKENRRLLAFAKLEGNAILLTATDTSWVNPATGALVFPDENGQHPEGSMPQYSFLEYAIQNGMNPFTIAEGAVMEAAALGRFDFL